MKAKETELTQELTAEAKATAKAKATERAKVVKQIVRLRKAGNGYPAIAKVLNDSGVPTLGKGKAWYAPVVRAICIRELGGAEESQNVRAAAIVRAA
jgi:Recombinase